MQGSLSEEWSLWHMVKIVTNVEPWMYASLVHRALYILRRLSLVIGIITSCYNARCTRKTTLTERKKDQGDLNTQLETHSSIMISVFKDVGYTIPQGYYGADLHPVFLKRERLSKR